MTEIEVDGEIVRRPRGSVYVQPMIALRGGGGPSPWTQATWRPVPPTEAQLDAYVAIGRLPDGGWEGD